MRKILLLIIWLTALGGQALAQSGQDFPSFGDEWVVEKNKIQLYPNPSVDFLHVTIENADLNQARFVVHNIIGNKFAVAVEDLGGHQYRIDVRDLPPGYYLLGIKDEQSRFSKTFKFLKR